MNITITGNLGSGKTSVCEELKKAGFEVIKTGTIFREIATEKGVSVIELNELAKTDTSIDKMLDNRSTLLGRQKDNTVFDSRMGWYFIPDSFKIFVLTQIQESARRVLGDLERAAEGYRDLNEATEGILKRTRLEQERFLELYHVNYYNQSNYNLIIDSTYATPVEVTSEIIREFELYKMEQFTGKTVFLNSKPETIDRAAYFFDFTEYK
ncbi:MAG: dephospho-CoA kinase [Sulfurospirillaceae bacterium]|nr:dephospho-CoA kinase [Sulfurospirillaceae bacterium]